MEEDVVFMDFKMFGNVKLKVFVKLKFCEEGILILYKFIDLY